MKLHRRMNIYILSAVLGVCAIVRADTHYVNKANATPVPGYTNGWASAAMNIQHALDWAGSNDVVLVASGVYDTGGRSNWPAGSSLTNRVVITNYVTVMAVSANPADTIIRGAADSSTNGPAAIRCVYLQDGSILAGFTLTNGHTMVTGTADTYGGGVYASSGTGGLVTNCMIAGCTSYAYGGGGYQGVYRNCAIMGNTVGEGVVVWSRGGGLYSAIAYDCVITRNAQVGAASGFSGGGGGSASTFSNCVISHNSAMGSGGGANTAVAYDCLAVSNFASGGGGGLAGTCTRCRILDNSATSYGGAGGGTFINCLITGNSTAANRAGVMMGGLAISCTMVSNYASGEGAAIAQGTVASNCVIYYNRTAAGVNAPGANYGQGWPAFPYNSCTTPMTNLPGNMTNDPMFINPGIGEYRLSSCSPCINAGTNMTWMTNALDLGGVRRIADSIVDIGAYEFLPRGTIITILGTP